MAVLSAFIIEEMLFAKWVISRTENTKTDWVAITYQFAREIEHSDENIERIEKEVTTTNAFKTATIVKAICAKTNNNEKNL